MPWKRSFSLAHIERSSHTHSPVITMVAKVQYCCKLWHAPAQPIEIRKSRTPKMMCTYKKGCSTSCCFVKLVCFYRHGVFFPINFVDPIWLLWLKQENHYGSANSSRWWTLRPSKILVPEMLQVHTSKNAKWVGRTYTGSQINWNMKF